MGDKILLSKVLTFLIYYTRSLMMLLWGSECLCQHFCVSLFYIHEAIVVKVRTPYVPKDNTHTYLMVKSIFLNSDIIKNIFHIFGASI